MEIDPLQMICVSGVTIFSFNAPIAVASLKIDPGEYVPEMAWLSSGLLMSEDERVVISERDLAGELFVVVGGQRDHREDLARLADSSRSPRR